MERTTTKIDRSQLAIDNQLGVIDHLSRETAERIEKLSAKLKTLQAPDMYHVVLFSKQLALEQGVQFGLQQWRSGLLRVQHELTHDTDTLE